MSGKFCPKCGAANDGSALFCTSCGSQLVASQASESMAPGSMEQKERAEAGPGTQQYSQPYVMANGRPPRRRGKGIVIVLLIVFILVLGAGILTAALISRSGSQDSGFYTIGGEQIPSVSSALSEIRTIQNVSQVNDGKVDTISMVYSASNAQSDMKTYADYLESKDGFVMRKADTTFEMGTGKGIQLWRNAKTAEHMIIIQIDYDSQGYTITAMYGEGQISGNSSNASNTADAETSDSNSESTEVSSGEDSNLSGILGGNSQSQSEDSEDEDLEDENSDDEDLDNGDLDDEDDVIQDDDETVQSGDFYENEALGFSIIPMTGWYASDMTVEGQQFCVVTTPDSNTVLITRDEGSALDDYTIEEEAFCSYFTELFGGNNYEIDRSESITFAGYECQMTGFLVEFDNEAQYYIFNYAFDGGSGNLYLVTYVLPPTATDADNQELQDVFSTFQITKSGAGSQ
ncbi:MAG: zinc-ribbon domain-containing protein [Lachnospiraceae bacterium]